MELGGVGGKHIKAKGLTLKAEGQAKNKDKRSQVQGSTFMVRDKGKFSRFRTFSAVIYQKSGNKMKDLWKVLVDIFSMQDS